MRAERLQRKPKIAAAAVGLLIPGAIDFLAGKCAIEKRSDRAVRDDRDGAWSRVLCNQPFNGRDNSPLGIDRALPAPNGNLWLSEELVGHEFELVGRKKACR